MVLKEVKQYILVIMTGTAIFAHIAVGDLTLPMSLEEKIELREEAKDMFYHAYRAYMENAYPADELMPLSCKGRWKDPLNSRGDLDDVLGNFSLTLVDSLDTLVILGDLEEFETGVKFVVKDVSFDQDLIVSVFETNIRVLGGLLSAHIFAEYFQHREGLMPWYRGELLTMAKDLGYRLLPAFNTTTGIPHAKVNLRHGLKNMRLSANQETCTACAGSMILEMAALSRLTGEPIFEQKAHKAMDGLWKMRHRSSDLMGTVLNVQSGDWVRRDSGVGAGIDSYYEYCLKAYILLGDEKYLGRFNKHYNAVMKYVSQGPMLVDVHMHRPHTNSKNFMDALLAFWPGLQVLKGDIKPAVETHEMLYQIMQRHNLIPDAFTVDFHVHWGQHPLRPEFLESTYFLYKATNDPYYLEVGKSALKGLQKFARVPCGYATIKDVRTGGHDDRMDSFVLAETFKYLYLLFAEPSDLLIDLDEFLFTTEAHLLPLSLSRKHNYSSFETNKHSEDLEGLNSEFARCCPNTLDLFPESVRKSLKNFVIGVCPRTVKRNLLASEFTAGNQEHLQLLKNMGIAVLSMADGRIQLVHTITSARSQADAKEGVLFMQEMLELSQSFKQVPEKNPLSVIFRKNGKIITVAAGPANFGRELVGGTKVTAKAAVAEPIRACGTLANADDLKGRVVIVERGDCMFVNKVRKVEEAGAIAAIVIDNTPGTSSATSSMFAMSGDGTNDVGIPAVFLFHEDAVELMKVIEENLETEVTVTDANTTGFVKFGGTSILEEVKKEKPSDIKIKKDKPSDVKMKKEEPSDVKIKKDKPSDVKTKKEKPSDVKTKKEKPSDGKMKKEKPSDGKTKKEKSHDAPRVKIQFQQTSGNERKEKETGRGGQRASFSADNESHKEELNDNLEWVQKTAKLFKNYANLDQDSQLFDIDFSGILKDLNREHKAKLSMNVFEDKLKKDFGYVLRFKMHVHLLINKIDETSSIIKSLLAVKPADWNEMHGRHLSKVKDTVKKLDESLKTIGVEAKYFEDPNCDIKLTSVDTIISNVKSKMDDVKKSLRRWDDSKTATLERKKNHAKNDDIIVVEKVKSASGSRKKPKRKNEL